MSAPVTRSLALLLLAAGCEDVQATAPDMSSATPDGGATEWARVSAADAGAGEIDFFAVSGSSATDVIIVGSGGTILRWDGMQLRREDSGTTADLHGVAALSPTLAFAVGAAGTIVKWDGTSWTQTVYGADGGIVSDGGAPPPAPYLTSVSVADEDNAAAVGQGGTLIGYHMASGWAQTAAGQDDLLGVSHDSQGYRAVGVLGTVMYCPGAPCVRKPISGFSKTLSAITFSDGGGWAAVGVEGTLLIDAGGNFATPVAGMPSVFLRGVAFADADLFAVGFDGTIVRVRAGAAFVYPAIADRWLYGVWAAAVDDVWIVGTSGLILHGPPPADPVPDGGA